MEGFAARLRKVMRDRGVSVTELAARSGISRQAVYKMLRTDFDPLSRGVRSVARGLGIDPIDLLPREGVAAARASHDARPAGGGGHRVAELRSIELHRAVARRLRSEPGLVARARMRIETWAREGKLSPHYSGRWLEVLALPVDALCAFLVEDSEAARDLRQVTPFAGVVPPRERWSIWRRIRAANEARP